MSMQKKLKQILDDSNVALANKGFNPANSLIDIVKELKTKEVNRFQYYINGEPFIVTADDLEGFTNVDLFNTFQWHLAAIDSNIREVILPSSITTIYDHTFRDYSRMEKITIPDSVTSIGEGAFDGCANLKSITIPDSVTSLGPESFRYCSGLGYLKIPASLKIDFYSCFSDTVSLDEVVISKGNGTMASYDSSTYRYTPWYNAININKFVIEEGVTNIGDYAFYASRVTNLKIPSSVTNIGDYAFYDINASNSYNSLTELYLYSPTPPTLGSNNFWPSRNITIHVPIGSGNAYKSATNWSRAAKLIVEDIVIRR